MKKVNTILFLVFCIFLLLDVNVIAQNWPTDTISVNINSGNPSLPFPQFLEYPTGKSLAKYNGVGVTHADMEKAIREAYQIMMHRAIYTGQRYGTGANQVKYIQFNPNVVPQNYGTFVSEGDGYALLAAAYMADKATFDGLWFWIHDNRFNNVYQYSNCAGLRLGDTYGTLPGWNCNSSTALGSTNANSATDGDVDIALGLLVAYKQWGEFMGINDACGNPISYKQEALKMIKAMVDTLYYTTSPTGAQAGVKGYMSGDIGIDGYIKSGNTFGELTNWRSSVANTLYPWAKSIPDPTQVTSVYPDYMAPAYFNEFAKFLSSNGGTPWEISQYQRAEASSDWVIGQMYNKGYIASAGNYSVNIDGSSVTFGSFAAGEDFRASWRTILNNVWHGNPSTTWNPVTHTITTLGNTFENTMAIRQADFLKFPRTLPSTDASANCGTLGASPDPSCPNWRGVAQIKQQYASNGSVLANYGVNWMAGAGGPAAVASGDIDLTAELYRQCEIVWDDYSGNAVLTDPQRYILSTPKYFHGWFRLLGMLVMSGNLQPPASITGAANMKVYMSVNKTYAYTGDLITYTVSYRNYGSLAASGVSIRTQLDPDYQFVSASNGGAYSGGIITWNVGNVPGFQTSTGLAPTTGNFTFVVQVVSTPPNKRVCLVSNVTASNSPTWTSNEYPNNASYTMERNCVDILTQRGLYIKKSTDRPAMNPGNIANFTLKFGNRSDTSLWLNGGRDRVILSYANYYPTNGYNFYQFYRLWHTAHESYINLGNYRMSYFMNDVAAIGIYNATTNPTGWQVSVDNQSDLDKYGYNPLTLPVNQQLSFTYQQIPWGSDANGSWNQRIVTQFAQVISAPSMHIYDKLGSDYLIHKGVTGPGFTRTTFLSTPASILSTRLADDWSYSTAVANSALDGQAQRFFPVSPTYTNFTNGFAPVVINNYSKDVCDPNVPNFSKILVEEFDGYTWRRIAGNGPLPGRESYNVQVYDTVPKYLTWKGFTDATALGIVATYTAAASNASYSGVITWSIPVMVVGSSDSLTYQAIANSSCPGSDVNFVNTGYIKSLTDSPDSSTVQLKITCNPVPPTILPQSSLFKTANKTTVAPGDIVTYKVKFINNIGAIATWNGTSTLATDWQALGSGVIPKINGSVISLDQNGSGNPSPGSYGYAFGPKKAYGTNGSIQTTITPTNSSVLSYIFRNAGGTPGQSNFQGVRLDIFPNPMGNNTITFSVYNNNTLLSTQSSISYGGSANPIVLLAKIVGSSLYVYVNSLSGPPLVVFTGITVMTPGYAGIYANGSQQVLTAFTASFDAAFNLKITDPVPSQLYNISSISNAGTLTGGVVGWPLVAGPILSGDSVVYTFQATVSICSNFITNIAYATAYGTSTLASQFVVYCQGSLGVQEINLEANKTDNGTVLTWYLSSPYTASYVVLESSPDGVNFAPIAKWTNVKNGGGYLDSRLLVGSRFYRLVAYQPSGLVDFSSVQKVSQQSAHQISVYPNPFTGETNVLVQAIDGTAVKIKIVDLTGKLVLENDNFPINTSQGVGNGLNNGTYILQIQVEDEVAIKKLIKLE